MVMEFTWFEAFFTSPWVIPACALLLVTSCVVEEFVVDSVVVVAVPVVLVPELQAVSAIATTRSNETSANTLFFILQLPFSFFIDLPIDREGNKPHCEPEDDSSPAYLRLRETFDAHK